MPKIYLASNEAVISIDPFTFEHLYLVYDPQDDYDPNNSATWNNDNNKYE
jgi:hypothetical protein